MKKTLFLLSLSINGLFNILHSQVFWTETFGTGCDQNQWAQGVNSGTGGWTVFYDVTFTPTSGSDEFFVSATEAGMGLGNCASGCLSNSTNTNRTLHVGTRPASGTLCPTGDCGAVYNVGMSSYLIVESPGISTIGKSNIILKFDYLEAGDGMNDNASVCYRIGPGPGPMWLSNPPKTFCGCATPTTCSASNPVGIWSTYTLAMPSSTFNQPLVRIGFSWINNGDNIGTGPSFAVDNIELIEQSVTSIKETVIADSFHFYPNPVKDMLHIEAEQKITSTIVEIISPYGNSLLSERLNASGTLDMSSFNTGIYFVTIKTEQKHEVLKIVKE